MKTERKNNHTPAPETNKPLKQFRAGALSVAVWRREHEGQYFYDATPSRAYTTDDGVTFQYVTTFDRDALPVVAMLCNLAFAWILAQPKEVQPA